MASDTASTAFTPSPNQAAIFDWVQGGDGSAIIEAVAGSGKTTTLIQMLPLTIGDVAFMAFNKKIVEEIESKVAKLDSMVRERVQVMTVHSAGWGAYRKAYRRVKLDAKKSGILFDRMGANPLHFEFATKAVSLAKQGGIGIFCKIDDRSAWQAMIDHFDLENILPGDGSVPTEQATDTAIALLRISNENADTLSDFDDMIYIPVLKGLRVDQYDWVFIDEAQDTNTTRLALAKMMLRAGGRLCAVGDPAQAIYGFAGADSESLSRIQREFNAITLPLTVSYRCPTSVVAEAQQWVSHIIAHESAPAGSVITLESDTFWKDYAAGLTVDDFILCRNNAPLVSAAYRLLAMNVACIIEGRDIGQGLIKLATKWKKIRTIGKLRDRLESYRDTETAKALARGNESRAESIADQVGCLIVIMGTLPDDEQVTVLRDRINSMFGDCEPGQRPRCVTLSSIHKSKGRERKRVFWYGRNKYNPSPYARQDWQMEQERNLCYVAATRAMDSLVYINV
jgi:DNA helicase-2/ATP-dependent DNA helicase PcrA